MSTRYNRPSPLVRIAIALAALIVLSEMGAAAPAQTADRQCWEYGNGSIRRSLTWVEQSRKTSHTFVEVARNPIFVELLDPVRHYTVRLYPHKVLLRGGKGGVKRLPKFARVSEGSWTDPDTRLDWQSPAGTFRAQNKEPGGTGASSEAAVWVERNFDGINVFRETGRTSEYVELKDAKRDYTVRLSSDSLKIRGGEQNGAEAFRRPHAALRGPLGGGPQTGGPENRPRSPRAARGSAVGGRSQTALRRVVRNHLRHSLPRRPSSRADDHDPFQGPHQDGGLHVRATGGNYH